MRVTLTNTLTDRPFRPVEVWTFLVRELVPVIKELLRALSSPPIEPVSSGTALSIDLSRGRDFAVLLDASSSLALTGGSDGSEGTFVVEQDAVGGHLLTVTAEGRTILRPDPIMDDHPDPGPGAITIYRYYLMSLPSGAYAVIDRTVLG